MCTTKSTIPNNLFYIWLGGEKPTCIQKCIDTFYKFFEGWNIQEINELVVPWDEIPLLRDLYDKKRYALYSDILRLYYIHKFGGVYVVTDVQLLKPIPQEYLQYNILPQSCYYDIDEVDMFVELKNLSSFLTSIGVEAIAINKSREEEKDVDQEVLNIYLPKLKKIYRDDYDLIENIPEEKLFKPTFNCV